MFLWEKTFDSFLQCYPMPVSQDSNHSLDNFQEACCMKMMKISRMDHIDKKKTVSKGTPKLLGTYLLLSSFSGCVLKSTRSKGPISINWKEQILCGIFIPIFHVQPSWCLCAVDLISLKEMAGSGLGMPSSAKEGVFVENSILKEALQPNNLNLVLAKVNQFERGYQSQNIFYCWQYLRTNLPISCPARIFLYFFPPNLFFSISFFFLAQDSCQMPVSDFFNCFQHLLNHISKCAKLFQIFQNT